MINIVNTPIIPQRLTFPLVLPPNCLQEIMDLFSVTLHWIAFTTSLFLEWNYIAYIQISIIIFTQGYGTDVPDILLLNTLHYIYIICLSIYLFGLFVIFVL